MASVKFKKKLLFASSSVLFTMYIILTDMVPVDPEKGFIYLPPDIANISTSHKTRRKVDDGSCILMDTNRAKRSSVDLRVVIITYNRPYSLWRLLESLEKSNFENDSVVFEIWLDRSKTQLVHNETLQAALDFKFRKGKCNVFVHPVHVGITGQWLMTWHPESNSTEIGVILEDDLTVSPHFYRYLKLVHKKYRHKRDIYGFSLQGTNVRHTDGKCCLDVPLENKVFLYTTLGTSGFSPNNRNWIEFHSWFKDVVRNKIEVPLIDNHILSYWYKVLAGKGKADSIWEMEYLYYTRKNKEFTLYPNFKDHRGFTFNWLEDGLHSTGVSIQNTEMERKSLVNTWTLDTDQLPDNPIYLDDSGAIIRLQENDIFG